MALLPFHVIDPQQAWQDATALTVDISGQRRTLLMTEAYCLNPACMCDTVQLFFSDLTGRFSLRAARRGQVLEQMRADWESERYALCCSAALSSRECEIEMYESQLGGYSATERDTLVDHLGRMLVEPMFQRLESHRRYVLHWREENWWRHEDWSRLCDGSVAWSVLHPSSPPFVVEVDCAAYAIVDDYCVRESCDCQSADLVAYQISDGKVGSESIGHVRVDAMARTFRATGMEGPSKLMHDIMNELVLARPGLMAVLRDRRRVMDEFRNRDRRTGTAARRIGDHDQARQFSGMPIPAVVQAEAIPENVSRDIDRIQSPARARVGRNAPCPCGSGRKYKKCCGRLVSL